MGGRGCPAFRALAPGSVHSSAPGLGLPAALNGVCVPFSRCHHGGPGRPWGGRHGGGWVFTLQRTGPCGVPAESPHTQDVFLPRPPRVTCGAGAQGPCFCPLRGQGLELPSMRPRTQGGLRRASHNLPPRIRRCWGSGGQDAALTCQVSCMRPYRSAPSPTRSDLSGMSS